MPVVKKKIQKQPPEITEREKVKIAFPKKEYNLQTTHVDNPDLKTVFKDFICTYCFPEIDSNNVFFTNQNLVSAPENTHDYITYQIGSQAMVGTSITNQRLDTDFEAPGQGDIHTMYKFEGRIDIHSHDQQLAMQRAAVLHSLCNELIGVDFFKARGIGMCGATGPMSVPYIDESGLFVYRYIITTSFTVWLNSRVIVEWFNELNVNLKPIV